MQTGTGRGQYPRLSILSKILSLGLGFGCSPGDPKIQIMQTLSFKSRKSPTLGYLDFLGAELQLQGVEFRV